MQAFKKFFLDFQILNESVDYRYPVGVGAAPFVMSDFYMLNYLRTSDLDLLSQYKKSDALRAEKYLDDIDYAEKQILPNLKKELLDDVFFAMCAEIRHVFRNVRFWEEGEEEEFKEDPFIKRFTAAYFGGKKMVDNKFVDLDSVSKRNKDDSKDYRISHAAIKSMIKRYDYTRHEVVKKFEELFSDLNWSAYYGGESWAKIARGWLRLNTAKTKDELYVAIDHIYDLQHNTDTVFNKLQKYYVGNEGHSWILKALDFKANLLSMQELIPKISGTMKKIARPFLQAIGDGPTVMGANKADPKNLLFVMEDFLDRKFGSFNKISHSGGANIKYTKTIHADNILTVEFIYNPNMSEFMVEIDDDRDEVQMFVEFHIEKQHMVIKFYGAEEYIPPKHKTTAYDEIFFDKFEDMMTDIFDKYVKTLPITLSGDYGPLLT